MVLFVLLRPVLLQVKGDVRRGSVWGNFLNLEQKYKNISSLCNGYFNFEHAARKVARYVLNF